MDVDLEDLARVDAELWRLARGEAQLRLRIGDALEALLSQQGHHELGFSTQKAYALERLSRSGRWADETRAMVRRLSRLPQLRRALERSEISWSMAELLSRHATAGDERAWLELSRGRTVHEMREAVSARATGGAWLAGRATPAGGPEVVQISVPPGRARQVDEEVDPQTDEDGEPEVRRSGQANEEREPEVRRSGQAGSGRPVKGALAPVTLRLPVRREVHLFYRALERAHRQLGAPHSFPRFLCESFWSTWAAFLGRSDKWEAIYRRDRYRCTSPVCFRQDCTVHHMRYGRDDPDDLVSACAWCHLDGEHRGRLHVEPPASQPTWLIGRQPILEVRGRDKRELCEGG